MMTLRQFAITPEAIPASTAWYLADLGEARGKQELFTRQTPQKLKVLREHALIESAISSNRIEGVEVEPSRVGTIIWISSASIRFGTETGEPRDSYFCCNATISVSRSGGTSACVKGDVGSKVRSGISGPPAAARTRLADWPPRSSPPETAPPPPPSVPCPSPRPGRTASWP